MRKTLLFLLLLSVKLTFGQLHDDFKDGNFTENPAWFGQHSNFKINTAHQLQSSLSAVSQVVSLSVANALSLNVKWEFSLRMSFDPSSTNLTRIYLIADQQDLKGSLNGYFIQIGEAGNADSYDLYRQSGTTTSKIIDGAAKPRASASSLTAKVKVTRSSLGEWKLYVAADNEANYVLEGEKTDLTFTQTKWFGVYCKYTATRSDGFIFDDFEITELVQDPKPPKLLSIKVLDDFNLEAIFSKALSPTSAMLTSNYLLNGQYAPISVNVATSSVVIKLRFANAFQSGNYNLTVNGMEDLSGNIAQSETVSSFYIKPYRVLKDEVVINEIFADPTPQIGLPQVEFVELWNTTDQYILLKGWKYADLTTSYTFSSDTLKPNSYLILSPKADSHLFESYGPTIGLNTWPSLNNDKDHLKLINPDGVMINTVAYADHWYGDDLKKQGGYSLELINPKNKCLGRENWKASLAPEGGTPGRENSIYRQQLNAESLKLLAVTIIDSLTISVDFNKSLDSLSASVKDQYWVNNGIGQAIKAVPQAPEFTTVWLQFLVPLSRGIESLLTVTNLKDCAGNLIHPDSNSAALFIAKQASHQDLLINEVLFNPKLGGVDFVELYNPTDHVLDLAQLQLANIDVKGDISNRTTISTTSVLIQPQRYWVLTTNSTLVQQHYLVALPKQIVQMQRMPAYPNERGTVVLLSANEVIDRFDYQDKMHMPLLKNVDGVALERVSFVRPTNEAANFKSAAATVGFATPTYQNSQAEDGAMVKNKVNLVNQLFSPDGDGFEDLLQIDYHFANAGKIASIHIYSDQGVLIRRLARNTTIATSGNFVWDGLNDAGQLSKVGIYVIKFDVFELNGRTTSYKETCVLAKKLN